MSQTRGRFKEIWRYAEPRSVLLFAALILLAALGLCVAVAVWGPGWLGNLGASITVTFVTAGMVDFLLVRGQRRRIMASAESRRMAADDAIDAFARATRTYVDLLARGLPEAPYWFSGTTLDSDGLAEHLGFWRERLRHALVLWFVQSGEGLPSLWMERIDELMSAFVAAYDRSFTANWEMEEMMQDADPPFGSDPPTRTVDALIVDAAVEARDVALKAHFALMAQAHEVRRYVDTRDLKRLAKHRAPSRIPVPLSVIAGAISVVWVSVLASAALIPAAFLPGFLGDNLGNLAADATVALAAGAIAIGIAQWVRCEIRHRAGPAAQLICELSWALLQYFSLSSADMRAALSEAVSATEDLVAVIMAAKASAELSLRARTVVASMRDYLGDGETPHDGTARETSFMELSTNRQDALFRLVTDYNDLSMLAMWVAQLAPDVYVAHI